jgi:hypothetical protein
MICQQNGGRKVNAETSTITPTNKKKVRKTYDFFLPFMERQLVGEVFSKQWSYNSQWT